ncbi:hypothetical protein [Streptomyces californicus]
MTANFRHILWPVEVPERGRPRRTDHDEDHPADAIQPDTETR